MKIFLNKRFQNLISIRSSAFPVFVALALALVTPSFAQQSDTAAIDKDQSPLNLIDQTAIGGATNSNNLDNASTAATLNDAIDLVSQDNDSLTTAATASVALDETPADAGNASTTTGASVTLGRRSVSDVGLAAIGVADDDATNDDATDTSLDSLIWRGTSATQANMLLRTGSVNSYSPTLSNLAHQVVAKQSVPPTGANANARDLVNARLSWLAKAGRSNDLAALAKQLPNDDQWVDWKKWLVQHQLMMLEDDEACRTISYQATQTFEPFWHQTKVICLIIEGDLSGAQFGADILQASGSDDSIFFALANEMLIGTPATDIDPALIEPIHIVLMDAAHHEIPLDGLAALPAQMAQSSLSLRYLSADARMVSTFDALTLGLIDAKRAAKLWRNIAVDADSAELALARHGSQPSALTRSMVWRALDSENTASRLPLIAAALDIDKSDRNAGLMVPLYAELARTALAFDGAETTLREDQSEAAGKIALLMALDRPESAALPSTFPVYDYADNAAKLLAGLDGDSWRNALLSDLNQWHLMPILESLGMVADSSEWLDLMPSNDMMGAETGLQTMSLSPLTIRAIRQSAEKRRVAETILLANRLFMSAPLATLNTNDVAIVISALRDVGQTIAARAIAREIITAHLLANTGNVDMATSTGRWIIPTADMADTGGTQQSIVTAADDKGTEEDASLNAEPQSVSDNMSDDISDDISDSVDESDNSTDPDNGTTDQ